MGDPVGAARHARERLAPGGTVLLVEPFAIDGRAKNIAENPMAALLYTASACICTPNSLSQEKKAGLGAQAGGARLVVCLREAGSALPRCHSDAMNLIFEATPLIWARRRPGRHRAVLVRQAVCFDGGAARYRAMISGIGGG